MQESSTDSATDTSGGSWSNYEGGSFAGGSFAFASVNYQSGGSDSATETDDFSDDGTFSLSGTSSGTSSGNECQVAASGPYGSDESSDDDTDNLSEGCSGSDTQTAIATMQSGDSYSLTEQGSYANDSYNLSNYLFSATDSGNLHSLETDTVGETETATGSFSGGDNQGDTSGVSGVDSLGSFSLTVGDSDASTDSGSITDTINATDTTTDTQAGTFAESLYQAGSFAGDSFSFASVVYSESSSDSSTLQSGDTFSSTDTTRGSGSDTGDQQGFASDGYNESGSDSFTGLDTISGTDTTTEQSLATASVYEAGNFANDSYALSSFALSQSGSDSMTASSVDSASSSESGSDTGTESIDGDEIYSGSGTFTQSSTSSGTSVDTASDGWNLSEQGTFANGAFALPCYVLSVQQSGGDSVSDSGASTESFSGSDQSQIYSGGDSGSFSNGDSDASAAGLTEQGSFGNNSFSLGTVSYSGSSSESFSARDGDSGSWTGGYSGTESSSDQSGGNDSTSEVAAGSYVNGSFSLSCYVLQGGSSGSYSSSESAVESLSGVGTGTLGGGSNDNFNRVSTGQESDSLYQSGLETANSYSNGSYNYSDGGTETVTEQATVPGQQSSDTWQQSDSTKETGSGSSGSLSESSAATYGFTDNGQGGTGTNSLQTTPSVTLPGAAALLGVPDVTTVPEGGADQSSGTVPVPASPKLGAVGVTSEWLSSQLQVATQSSDAAIEKAAYQAPQSDGPAVKPAGVQARPTLQNPKSSSPAAQPFPGRVRPTLEDPKPNQVPASWYNSNAKFVGPEDPTKGEGYKNWKEEGNRTFKSAISWAEQREYKDKFAVSPEERQKALKSAQKDYQTELDNAWKNHFKQFVNHMENARQRLETNRKLALQTAAPGDHQAINAIYDEMWKKFVDVQNMEWTDKFTRIGNSIFHYYYWIGQGVDPKKMLQKDNKGSNPYIARIAAFFTNRGGDLDLQIAIQITRKDSGLQQFLKTVKEVMESRERPPRGMRSTQPEP